MAGNANSGGNGKNAKKGPEMVQRCRAAVLGALDLIESDTGKTISELLAAEHQNNPAALLELAHKFKPKNETVYLSQDVKGSLTEQGQSVINATASGEIAPADASAMLQAIAAQAKIVEVEDIVKRIESLEKHVMGAGR